MQQYTIFDTGHPLFTFALSLSLSFGVHPLILLSYNTSSILAIRAKTQKMICVLHTADLSLPLPSFPRFATGTLDTINIALETG
jgi:hypothetical protein